MNAGEVVAQAEQVAEQVSKKPSMAPVIVVAIIFAIIIIGGLVFGLVLMQKQKEQGGTDGNKNDNSGNGEKESGGTGNVVLLDTKRLVSKVEDIEDGIITTDDGKRFIAAITCRGMDFYNESSTEQLSIMRGYQEFWNIANSPMTYRLYSKAVDLDTSKERYMNKYRETRVDLDSIEREIQTAIARRASEAEVLYLRNEYARCENRMKHLEAQMQYMDFYSSTDIVMDLTQDYIFDWTYEPGLVDAKLTKAEIFKKAKAELMAIAGQKITALSAAGVKARRCTNDEILDAFRRNSKPITSEEYKQRAVSGSSFYEDIITSDSIDNMVAAIREEDLFVMEEAALNNQEEEKEQFIFGGHYGDED